VQFSEQFMIIYSEIPTGYMISVRQLSAMSLKLELTNRDDSCIDVHTAF